MIQLFQKFVLNKQSSQDILKGLKSLQADNQAYNKQKDQIEIKIKALPKQIQEMLTDLTNNLKLVEKGQKHFLLNKKEEIQNELVKTIMYEKMIDSLKLIVQEYIQICLKQDQPNNKQLQASKLFRFINKIQKINQIQFLSILEQNCKWLNNQINKQTQAYQKNLQQRKQLLNNIITKFNQNVQKIQMRCEQILVQKCKKFVSTKNNNLLMIIEKNKIIDCLEMITKKQQVKKSYFNITLNQCIQYDIQYQEVILLKVLQIEDNGNQIIVSRQKVSFKKQKAQEYTELIVSTIQKHINLAFELIKMLKLEQDKNKFLKNEVISRQIQQLRSNLQYITPFLKSQQRKKLFQLISQQYQIPRFEDFLIRLKLKNQEADQFVQNVQNIFNHLISKKQNQIVFNQEKFSLFFTFLQLNLFQAQQSLINTTSKAFSKIAKGQILKKQVKNSLYSKKMLNIILLTISHLIQKLQEMCQNNEADQWIDSLIQVRQHVRKKIHQNLD